MTYDPTIPQPSDSPAQSQGQILTNFGQLNTVFDVDHIPFNDGTAANRGKHDKSTYVESSDPATVADEVAVYSKDDGAGNTRLYMRQESAGTVIQMSGADPVSTATGSSFLPGGLIIAWGRNTVANGGMVTVSSMTTIRQVTFTIEDAVGTTERAYITAVATNTFTISTASGSNVVIRYIAVGV